MDARVYDLNLIPGSVPQIIRLNQYDKGIPFKFTVYQGDEKFSIPSGSTVLLTGTKPDGLGFTYSCTFSGSEVSVTIGDQVAVLCGNVRAELTILSGNSVRLGTANFTFFVEPAALKDDTAVSDSDFPEIVKAVNNINAARDYASQAASSASAAKSSATSAASAAKNAISDETNRAKKAEADNKKLTNDLKTSLTDGTLKVAKAKEADFAGSLDNITCLHIEIPDNGGRRKYLLFYDITDWITKTSGASTYSFDGIFISRRTGGFVNNNCVGVLSLVASWNGTDGDGERIVSDNNGSLRLRTTSSTYVPTILHNKMTDKYYLSLMTNGSGRALILFGIFQGTFIGTWVENTGSTLSNGALPEDYEVYSQGYYSIPSEKAVADKNGKDITEYLSGVAYSSGTLTFNLGNGNKKTVTIPDASSSTKGLVTTSDKAMLDRIGKINLSSVLGFSNIAWASQDSALNADISKLLPGKYQLSAKFTIEKDNSAGLTCSGSSWMNQIIVYCGNTIITPNQHRVDIPIGTEAGYTVTNYCIFNISEANAHATNFHAYFYLAGDGTPNRPYVGSVSNIELTMVN